MIGRVSPPETRPPVTMEAIQRYCYSVDDLNPLYLDEVAARRGPHGGIVAPPFFFAAPGFRATPLSGLRPDGLPSADDDPLRVPTGAMQSRLLGSALEVFGQVRPGDILTKQSRLVDVFEKDGRSGTMLFSVRETRVTNQIDQLVCIDRVTTAAVPQRPESDTDSIRPGPTHAPARRGVDIHDTPVAWETERLWTDVAQDDEIAATHRTITPIQVFLFGAVRMNSHQIHYDRDYAQREGLPDRVAHGDLLGDLLCQLVTRWMGRTGTLRRYSYEVRAPGFVGETIAHFGTVTRRWRDDDGRGLVELELRSESAGGRLCLRGAATVELVA